MLRHQAKSGTCVVRRLWYLPVHENVLGVSCSLVGDDLALDSPPSPTHENPCIFKKILDFHENPLIFMKTTGLHENVRNFKKSWIFKDFLGFSRIFMEMLGSQRTLRIIH